MYFFQLNIAKTLSFQHVINVKITEIFYIPSLDTNPVYILQHIFTLISHISGVQLPHVAGGYSIGHHRSGFCLGNPCGIVLHLPLNSVFIVN